MCMWSSPEKPIPKHQIEEDALRVVREAVADSAEFDVAGREELQQALDVLEGTPAYTYGASLVRRAFREGDLEALYRGMEKLGLTYSGS